MPPGLRFLKGLVIALTLTMIVGVITVVAVLVTRMPRLTSTLPVLPDQLTLPPGTTAAAVTAGDGWFAVVTTDNRILILDHTGKLRQDIKIQPTSGN